MGLTPKHSVVDPLGHRENLRELIERINSGSPQITADLICYACIKTNPPQSEIFIKVDSSGVTVERVIDIRTPVDDILTSLGVHN